MNIHLNEERDKKLNSLKEKFNINSKEETIMRLIDQFPMDELEDTFDVAKETEKKIFRIKAKEHFKDTGWVEIIDKKIEGFPHFFSEPGLMNLYI